MRQCEATSLRVVIITILVSLRHFDLTATKCDQLRQNVRPSHTVFSVVKQLFFPRLEAKDLGTYGHTYKIEEKNLMTAIRERLTALNDSECEQLFTTLQERFIDLIRSPKPLEGIGESTAWQVYEYDPSVCLSTDILDHNGEVLFPKGKKVNPLDHVSLSQDLLFFDGSNPDHVAWAKKQKQDAMWILVNGRPLELEESESRPVYFDQFGVLTKKLGIQNVPAKVSQSGSRLQICIERVKKASAV